MMNWALSKSSQGERKFLAPLFTYKCQLLYVCEKKSFCNSTLISLASAWLACASCIFFSFWVRLAVNASPAYVTTKRTEEMQSNLSNIRKKDQVKTLSGWCRLDGWERFMMESQPCSGCARSKTSQPKILFLSNFCACLCRFAFDLWSTIF